MDLLKEKNRKSILVQTENRVNDRDLKEIISQILTVLLGEEDNAIEISTRLLLEYFDADQVYIALFDDKQEKIFFLQKSLSDLDATTLTDLKELPYEEVPWTVQCIKQKIDIVCDDLSQLPPEADIDRRLLVEKQKLKSMLILPLVLQDKAQGAIGFDFSRNTHYWTEKEISDLRIIVRALAILTDRKQAHKELEESHKYLSELATKFKSFFDNMPLGVELYDAQGNLLDANKADLDIFGSDLKELLGINLFDNPNMTEQMLHDIRNGSNGFTLTGPYQFKKVKEDSYYHSTYGQQTKYIEAKGMSLTDPLFGHIGYLLIVSDLTESQQKTELLKNNLAMLKAILLDGYSIVGEYDPQKGSLYVDPKLNDYANKSHIFNYVENNSLSFKEMFKYSSFPKIEDTPLHNVVSGKEEQCSFVCNIREKEPDGGNNSIWLHINALAYTVLQPKKVRRIICHLKDVTDKKELEERLRKSEEESRLAELEKLKAQEADKLKSAFLANMSHEIRTPLNAIIGFSSLLLDSEDLEERKTFSEIISKNNDLLLRLITDILDFSKIESGALEYNIAPANIKEIVSEQYKVHSLKIPQNISLIYDIDSLPDVIIHTDQKRVTQVLSNLITNAIKFTRQGSITLSYKQTDREVTIEVTDTGIGIPSNKQKAIFDRFVKLDSFQQGTGLGLTICKTIVEALKGKIGMHSALGAGSCFWFTLPCQIEP